MLALYMAAPALASTKLICADRARDTHSIDITGIDDLAPGETFSTELKFMPFRSYAYKITGLNCVKPSGNSPTAEMPPALVCKSQEYDVLVQAEADGTTLTADVYDHLKSGLLQSSIPCLLTTTP